jgi:hypothetical protein
MIGKTFNIHFNDFIKINELVEHDEFNAKEYGDSFFQVLSKHFCIPAYLPVFVIPAIISLSNNLSPKYLLLSLYTNSSR